MKLPWLAACVLAGLCCSNRQHTNPFDPRNPDTDGRPLRLWAIPGTTYTRIHWSVPAMPDIEMISLLRIPEGGHADTVMKGLSHSGSWIDPASSSDLLSYLLEVRVLGWTGIHRSDTAVAAPSAGACWVASGYDHLAIVSPRTASLMPSISLGSFIVDAGSAGPSLWAAGMPGGMVYRIEAAASGPHVAEYWATSLSIRSIDYSPTTDRVLLAHAEGLAWLDPLQHRLDSWPFSHSAAPRLARLATDEAGAWIACVDNSLVYVPCGSASPAVAHSLEDVADISPGPGQCCWAGGGGGVVLLNLDGVRRIMSTPVRAIAAVSADRCWVCLEEGSVELVTSEGVILSSRALGGRLLCFAREVGMLWVADDKASLWKLFPDLRTAAHLDLQAPAWAILPGPAWGD